MRLIFLLLAAIAAQSLAAECPDSRYLPGNYQTGARINLRGLGNFLERNGIAASDLKYLEKPGIRDGASWFEGFEYTDIESIVAITREREKDFIALVCFASEAKLAQAKRKLFARQKQFEEKSGRKFSVDEKTGEGVLDDGKAAFFITKRSFVFGDTKAINRFRENYHKNRVNSKGFVGRLGTSKAEILLSVDTKALGASDTRDLPDFAGLREISAQTRAFEMQLALQGRPQITASMVMTNSAMARRVSALFNVFKELAIQFSGNIDERQARKAIVSLLTRMQFRAKGNRAELNLKLNKLENSLLIAWLGKEISEGKERHANHKLALAQEQVCSEILSGKYSSARIAKVSNVNLRTSEGNYLLHCAAAAGNLELVKELLRRGAKPQLTNGNDESAYEAAFNARHFAVAESLLPKPNTGAIHNALVELAQKAPGLRLTAQADGRRTATLQSPLEFEENTIRLVAFEFAWDTNNPLVHPPREGAVYDVVFTFDQYMPANESADSQESESETGSTEAAEDKEASGAFTGTLVSARDPQYKPEPASDSPAASETPEESEDAPPTDQESNAIEAEPETQDVTE